MHHIALIPWLDPAAIIDWAGPWALLVVCFIVFAETGLLVGFLLPGDTLLVISGLLAPEHAANIFGVNIWVVSLLIALSAFIGGEVGYFIGHKGGPAVFERKESGVFSVKNVERTNAFFERFGGLTIILARFVPIVRTFAPVAAGVGHMHKGKYTLYNFIGAMLWGFGLTMFGYLIGFIPWVADLVDRVHRHHPAGRRRRHRARHAVALPQRAPQGEEGRRRGRGCRHRPEEAEAPRARPRGLRPRPRAPPTRRAPTV